MGELRNGKRWRFGAATATLPLFINDSGAQMLASIESRSPSVRVAVNLPPAVAVAGLMQAQRRKQKLADWLAHVVVQACSSATATTAAAEQRLGERLATDLFVYVASRDPALLTKRWKLLYERCQLEPGLWTETKMEGKGGEEAPPELLRRLNPEAVRERWPALVASVWLTG